MIEQIKQNAELMHQLKDIENAKDLADKLTELGFNCSYLTLKNKQQELQDLKDGMAQEKRRLQYDDKATQFGYEAGEYTKDQVVLVRVADVFSPKNILKVPTDGQVLSHTKPTFEAYNLILKSLGLFENKWDYQLISDNDSAIKEKESKIYPLMRQYRSTKHFTLNTIVSENGGGCWDGMPYIYFEKFINHIDDKGLANIAPHDTFFRGDVKLIDPTLMLKQEHLQELLSSCDPVVLQTLKETNLLVLDNNCEENASIQDHVGYVLRYLMNSPFYKCYDHNVNIDSKKGVFSTIVEDAEQRGLSIGTSHYYTKEKKLDELHFARNIAQDQMKYLKFIRDNERFNLTDEQKYYFDRAIEDYDNLTLKAQERGLNLNFTEENAPIPKGFYKEIDGKEFNDTLSICLQLGCLSQEALERAEFYENVDIQVLEEETTKYNEQFREEIKQNIALKEENESVQVEAVEQ